jgi:hypothetical protein
VTDAGGPVISFDHVKTRHRLHQEAPSPQPRARRHRLRGPPDPRQDPKRPPDKRPRRHGPHHPRRLAGVSDRRVRGGRHHQRRGVSVHRRRRRTDPPSRRVRGVPPESAQRRRARDPLFMISGIPTVACSSRTDSGEDRQRTTRPRQHRVHDADLPAPPTQHASRRCPIDRAARQAHSPARRWHGGTSGEPPEEDRLNRGNTRSTRKAQGFDLGLHLEVDGGGGI